MLVTKFSAKKCCEFCESDFGHSDNRKAKLKLKRTIRRRENQQWKKEISRG